MATKSKYFTIGELFRLGLLKNHKGEPYKDKATVSRIVGRLKFKLRNTPWGQAKTISEKDINTWNNRLNMLK